MIRFISCVLLTLGAACFTSAQTGLTVAPQDLSFAVATGSSTPATATLAVGLTGGDAPFTATVRYLSNPGGWLNLTPQNGITPATLSVSASGSQLQPGTYTAQITIAAAGLGRAVNVTLVVGATPGTGGLLLSNPTGLTFLGGTAGEQSAPPLQIGVFTPPGVSPVTFRVVTSTAWLSVPPGNITTPATIPVVAYQTGLEGGIYSGSLSLIPVSGGSPTVVPVTLKAGGAATTQYRLTLNQSSILVNHLLGSATPNARLVPLATNIPLGTGLNPYPPFTASTSTPWIRMTSNYYSDPVQYLQDITIGNLGIHVDPTGLPAGTYTGNVVIQPDGLPVVNLPVTLRVVIAPELNGEPSSLILNDSSATAAVGNIVVSSTNDIPLSFTVTTSSGSDWLKVTPSSLSTGAGTAGSNLLVTFNQAGLSNGTYNGSIILSASNGTTLTIPVRADISAANVVQTTLAPNPTSIALSGIRGQANPSQILQVATETGRVHPFTAAATSTEGWLTVDTFNASAPTRINVSANLAVLPGPGSYTGSVTLTSLANNTATSIPVTLQVQDDVLSVSPGQLTFVQPQRFGAFTPQELQIRSITPNATFRFLDVPSWLYVSDLSGAAPRNVTLYPVVSLLPPGSNASVAIRIQGPNNTVSVPVSFALAAPPALTPTPEAVNLTYALGGVTLPTQTVKVETGSETTPFSVKVSTENNRDWLKVTPLSGTTPAELRVAIDPALVTTGRLNGTISVALENGSGQIKTIPVVLAVNPPAAIVEAVLHSATQTPTPVAPGLMITLTGNGFGSVNAITPRPSAAGAYETRVAETRVLFDGVPAPILYLRSDQINVIAPYSLYGRVSTRLQVEQGGNLWSLPVDLRVVDSQPGLFTAGGSGRGQASAVNQDFSPNSVLNPAERGSVITVFGTGEGQTDAPGQDGRIISSDLRRPLLPVTATIGGKAAEVLYAGSASALVSGTLQVNLRVPVDVTPGIVPIQIQIGNTMSPSSVTVVVK